MKIMKIHYIADKKDVLTIDDWPVRDYKSTTNPNEVTCKTCIKMMKEKKISITPSDNVEGEIDKILKNMVELKVEATQHVNDFSCCKDKISKSIDLISEVTCDGIIDLDMLSTDIIHQIDDATDKLRGVFEYLDLMIDEYISIKAGISDSILNLQYSKDRYEYKKKL